MSCRGTTSVTVGGRLSLRAGSAASSTGGAVSLLSGHGTATSSGVFSIQTSSAGDNGVSGSLAFSSGSSSKGSSGMITLRTGSAISGAGGSISVAVQAGTIASGGRVTITAGESTAKTGGAVSIVSGYGTATSSGAFSSIRTANAGADGQSGSLTLFTGDSTKGLSGYSSSDGRSFKGASGSVSVMVGVGPKTTGGRVTCKCWWNPLNRSVGPCRWYQDSEEPHQVARSALTADSGENGVSGDLHLDSGISTKGSVVTSCFDLGLPRKVPAAILVS